MSIAQHHLLNRVRIRLTGASDAAIKLVLHDVLDEFFTDSNAWIEDVALAIQPNVVNYTFTLAETPPGQIKALGGVLDTNKSVQPALLSLDFTTITLRDTPSKAMTFTASLIKTVAPETTPDLMPQAPEWVFQHYYRFLLDGVLGKMMVEDNKPYANETLGLFYQRRFRAGVAKARVAAAHRNSFGVNVWVFPQGWGSRTQRGGISAGNSTQF